MKPNKTNSKVATPKIQKKGAVVIGIIALLMLLPNVLAYQSYLGITFESASGTSRTCLPEVLTRIVIPGVYNETIVPDSDGKWCVNEITYTNAIDVTSGTEYTVEISVPDGISSNPITYISPRTRDGFRVDQNIDFCGDCGANLYTGSDVISGVEGGTQTDSTHNYTEMDTCSNINVDCVCTSHNVRGFRNDITCSYSSITNYLWSMKFVA